MLLLTKPFEGAQKPPSWEKWFHYLSHNFFSFVDTELLQSSDVKEFAMVSFRETLPNLLVLFRLGSFPFRKRSMPFSRHLEVFSLTVNEFFSTKLKKKENLQVTT